MKQIETIKTGKNFSAVSVVGRDYRARAADETECDDSGQGVRRSGRGCYGQRTFIQTLVPGPGQWIPAHTQDTRGAVHHPEGRGTSIRWTARFSPSARAPSSVWLPMASVH